MRNLEVSNSDILSRYKGSYCRFAAFKLFIYNEQHTKFNQYFYDFQSLSRFAIQFSVLKMKAKYCVPANIEERMLTVDVDPRSMTQHFLSSSSSYVEINAPIFVTRIGSSMGKVDVVRVVTEVHKLPHADVCFFYFE